MTAAEAARIGDDIGHTSALGGLLAGIAAGLVVGLLIVGTIATGGLLGVALGAVFVAGMGATGGLIGMSIGQRNDGNIAGKIGSGSPDVFTVGRKQARTKLDFVDCDNHSVKYIATGSSTVFVNREMAARRGDQTECDGKLHSDQETVLIGGETALAPGMSISPEVPEWLVDTLVVVAWAGGIAGGLLMIPVIGVVGATLSFAGGLVGGHYGGQFGRWVGSHWGESGAFWGELVGGFGGGMLGGAAGARGGMRLDARRLAAKPGNSPAQIAARREVLYSELTRPTVGRDGNVYRPTRAQAASKVQGSDLNQPVRARTLDSDGQYQQFRNQGQDGVGNWQAKAGSTPDELGLGEYGYNRGAGELQPKEVVTVTVPKGTRVVESTAAPITDTWSASTGKGGPTGSQYAPGGGQQTYVHNNGGVGLAEGAPPPAPITPKGPPPDLGPPPPAAAPPPAPPQGAGVPPAAVVNPITGMGGASGGDGGGDP